MTKFSNEDQTNYEHIMDIKNDKKKTIKFIDLFAGIG